MRCSAGGRGVTNLPTSLRGPGVCAGASKSIKIREIGITNTTTTAFAASLLLISTSGTQAGGLTEVALDDPGSTPGAAAFTSQSSDSTAVGAAFGHVSIGAAIGSGWVWTFGENGIIRAAGTGNGIIINLPTGTGQFFDFYIHWDE